MNAVQTKGDEIASAIHLEFIRNVAASGEDRDKCAEAVESYHRAIFLSHSGKEVERLDQDRRLHEDRLAHLEIRLKEARDELARMPKLLAAEVEGAKDNVPSSPWNNWDRAMFVAAALGIACLLVFGVLNISFNLLESGIVTFLEHPLRAYFWAALLPVAALAVKVGWDSIKDRRRKDRYLWGCLAGGFIGVACWLGAFATVYPNLSKTTDEHIRGLTVFDAERGDNGSLAGLTSGQAKRVDTLMLIGQGSAEIFLSAALGIFMTLVYLKHRPVRLAQNPYFMQLDQERELLEEHVEQERSALAVANGGEVRLRNQLTVFVAYAKSLFHKELALRQDSSQQKYRLLAEIQNELRNKLQSVDEGQEPFRPLPLESKSVS